MTDDAAYQDDHTDEDEDSGHPTQTVLDGRSTCRQEGTANYQKANSSGNQPQPR